LSDETKEREDVMIRSKSLSGMMVVVVLFAMAAIDYAAAGEKVKSRATSVRTKWHSIEVGDEGGHTIAVFENKNVYFNEKTGEKSTGISSGLLDMNFKTGKGTVNGYVVRTYSNGDKVISSTEGKPVGKGHSKGTFTIIRGTGKYKGIEGNGTWESKSLAPGISELIIEGETEMPNK
jgi:hypothetical protein